MFIKLSQGRGIFGPFHLKSLVRQINRTDSRLKAWQADLNYDAYDGQQQTEGEWIWDIFALSGGVGKSVTGVAINSDA